MGIFDEMAAMERERALLALIEDLIQRVETLEAKTREIPDPR